MNSNNWRIDSRPRGAGDLPVWKQFARRGGGRGGGRGRGRRGGGGYRSYREGERPRGRGRRRRNREEVPAPERLSSFNSVFSDSQVQAVTTAAQQWRVHVQQEQQVELQAVQQRWKRSKESLIRSGHCLDQMSARRNGYHFGMRKLRFLLNMPGVRPENSPVYRSQFSSGDMVRISRQTPEEPGAWDATVLRRTCTALEVLVDGEGPPSLTSGVWRLDQGFNEIPYKRMREALDKLQEPSTSVPVQLLQCLVGDLDKTEVFEEIKSNHTEFDLLEFGEKEDSGLNESQQRAVSNARRQAVSLVQGPPGTGKTYTTAHLVRRLLTGQQGGKTKVLLSAYTNVAVDTLTAMCLRVGLKPLRIGSVARIGLDAEDLEKCSANYLAPRHPLGAELEQKKTELRQLGSQLSTLRGREKGMGHARMSRLSRECAELQQRLYASLCDEADVVCATCVSAASDDLKDLKFDVVVVDEASQCAFPAALVPLLKCTRAAVLVGDHRQLPPTSQTAAMQRSLFEHIVRPQGLESGRGVPMEMLQRQFRMHSALMRLPSRLFYQDRLLSGVKDSDRRLNMLSEKKSGAQILWRNAPPIHFFDHSFPEERPRSTRDSESSLSWANPGEAEACAAIVQRLLTELPTDMSIAVVTPYSAQRSLLRRRLARALDRLPPSRVDVRTVDGFQGGEADVVVFASTRNNATRNIGFLADARRFNVAFTRARYALIVLGNGDFLAQGPPECHWRQWMQHVRQLLLHSEAESRLAHWRHVSQLRLNSS